MRPGRRLLVAALAAGTLALSGPAAVAKGGSTKKPTASSKVPALTTDVARIEPLATGGATPTVSLEGVGEYRGLLEVRRAGGGVGAVNEVALDDYVAGIAEVPSSWPAEVLRAQAIAARTYLLWTLGNGASGSAAALGAQICATESCQVYSGVAKERSAHGAAWAAAVRDTSGLALLSGGSPILAKYSACNGGRSVSGGKPYLKVIDDPDDARCPLHRWGLTVSYDDLGRALAVPGTVKAVRATQGDVLIDWAGPDGAGGRLTVPRTQFRAKVGSAVPPPPDRSRTVPSILFTLRPDDGARVATLDGRGFGHAIGMSQWGAYGKGQRGMKAGAILAAYYGGIQPTQVPAAKLPKTVRVAIESGKADPPKPQPTSTSGPKTAATAKPAPPAGNPDAVVSASGPFRILDSKGKVVVPVATGAWRIVPAGQGLKLLPPKGQNGPPGLTVLGVEPAAAVPGQPLTVRFKSNLPAVVSVAAQPPGGPEAPVLEPRIAGTDEVRVTLPAAAVPGIYSVTLSADSGPGREATTTVAPAIVNVGGPPAADPPIEAGLNQELLSAERRALSRASRSESVRTVGAAPAGDADPLGGSAAGLLLASLAGVALWRFRSRASGAAQGVVELGGESLDVVDRKAAGELPADVGG
ncbi:MAG TPA: SpoIID/LytB domain-containing protein, partial [Acidimicrobiia bacterium]|nr:SpoIID/LytB domain-containing protein [Acidimicrobiia bacterium]